MKTAGGKRRPAGQRKPAAKMTKTGKAGQEGLEAQAAGYARAGRPREFESPEALEQAVSAYFGSISREITVTEMAPTGERDDKGHQIYETVAVKNDQGQEIRTREFVVPPTVTALCLRLGITRQTWANYGKTEGFAPVVAEAKAVMLAYLEEQLLTRQKGLQGVMFNLQNNYDWRIKTELEAGPETRKEVSAASIPLDEKLKLLEGIFRQTTEPGETGDD